MVEPEYHGHLELHFKWTSSAPSHQFTSLDLDLISELDNLLLSRACCIRNSAGLRQQNCTWISGGCQHFLFLCPSCVGNGRIMGLSEQLSLQISHKWQWMTSDPEKPAWLTGNLCYYQTEALSGLRCAVRNILHKQKWCLPLWSGYPWVKALSIPLTHATSPALVWSTRTTTSLLFCISDPPCLMLLDDLRMSNISALSDAKWCKIKSCSVVSRAANSSYVLFYSHNWSGMLTRKLKFVLRNTKRTLTKAAFKELGSMKETEMSIEEEEI